MPRRKPQAASDALTAQRKELTERLDALSQRDRAFAESLLGAENPTEKQQLWIRRLIEIADEPPIRIEKLDVIVGMLTKGRTNLKAPRIRFMAGGLPLSMSFGRRARTANEIGVKGGSGVPYGRISPDGRFDPNRNLDTDIIDKVVFALQEFAAHPVESAVTYGRIFGTCCFCRFKLVDPVSVAVGYGPICAAWYGLEHRATGLTSQSVEVPVTV